MPDSIGSEASIATFDVLQGKTGVARRRYHASFAASATAEQVMTAFKGVFVHNAAEAAKRGNITGATALHRFASQLWGEKEMWEILSAALVEQILDAVRRGDHAAIWSLRAAIIDCRPSAMSAPSAMHFFWKQTGIKVRHLRRPSYEVPVDRGSIFEVAAETMSLAVN